MRQEFESESGGARVEAEGKGNEQRGWGGFEARMAAAARARWGGDGKVRKGAGGGAALVWKSRLYSALRETPLIYGLGCYSVRAGER